MTYEQKLYRLGQLEMAVDMLQRDAHEKNLETNRQLALAQFRRNIAATAPKPKVINGPEDLGTNPTYAEIQAAVRAVDRKPKLQSIIDPSVGGGRLTH